MKRVCRSCTVEKDLEADFHRKRGGESGRARVCKSCRSLENKLSHANRSEESYARHRARALAYYYRRKGDHARAAELAPARRDRDVTATSRVCTKCGIEKPLATGFYRKTAGKFGHTSQCKPCTAERIKTWFSKVPEERMPYYREKWRAQWHRRKSKGANS